MRITLAGPSCSGKSTLQKEIENYFGSKIINISHLSLKMINQYLGEENISLHKEIIQKIMYLRSIETTDPKELIETERQWMPINRLHMDIINSVSELSENKNIHIVSHLDFLGFYAHGYALFQGKYEGIRKEFAKLFQEFIAEIPYNCIADYTVILYISYHNFIQRAKKRKISPDKWLYNKNYFKKQNEAYDQVAKIIGEDRVFRVSGDIDPQKIINMLEKKIESIPKMESISQSKNNEVLNRLIQSLIMPDKKKELSLEVELGR